MKLKPLSDHLIVKPLDAETTTASGIIIPDTAQKERPEKGTVLAVGPGRRNEKGERQALDVTVGDTIVFKKYGADEVKIDGEEYLVLTESDIVAIIEN
ncbi:MAG: co-chaperone GroES [bacterium]|nr:co-chaperone GroES [bacterium]MDA1024614.1 co-chaperone GroES [bacterium]